MRISKVRRCDDSLLVAGRRGGIDLIVLAAYTEYGRKAQEDMYDIETIDWIIAHSSCHDGMGGCKWNDRTWHLRESEFDAMTCAEVEFDAGCPIDRDNPAADIFASATLIPERAAPVLSSDDEMDDFEPHAGVRNLYD